MNYFLRAHEVPKPSGYRGFLRLKDGENALRSNAPIARGFRQGETLVTSSKLNRNSTQLDLTGRYGGGGYGIAYGLSLRPGDGLNVIVDPGHAMIDGVVEIFKEEVLAVPAYSESVHLWLLQNGTFSVIANSLKVPDQACCYIGSCQTSLNAVTQVDQSGVMFLRGGFLWRHSGDAGVPLDYPECLFPFFHKTRGGTYFWDGSQYLELLPPGIPRWMKYSKTFKDFSTTEKVQEISLGVLPEGTLVQGIRVQCQEEFTGPDFKAFSIGVGYKGSGEGFCKAFSVYPGTGGLIGPPFLTLNYIHRDRSLELVLSASSSHPLNLAEKGRINIWVLYSVLV